MVTMKQPQQTALMWRHLCIRLSPILLCAALLAAVLAPAVRAENRLEASVDRTRISANESLQLSVTGTMEVQLNFNIFNLRLPSPELEPLLNDFQIIDQRQRYNLQSINGKNHATVTWVYTLMPKRSGTLQIPALKFKDALSAPIEIEVSPQAAATSRQESLFLEAEVSKEQAYVQEQLIYTLRLYYQDNILNGDITEPEIANAIVKPLEKQKEYSQVVDGRRYEVIERSYAILPQTSGTLQIDAQQFTGNVFDMRRRDRRYMKASSDAMTVEVLAPPTTSGQAGQTWLPAMSLSLTEHWSRTPDELDVGDSVTRTLTIKALGLEGSQLPPLPEPEVPGLKLYPEQAQIDTETHADGVTGTRIQRTAVVAVKGGSIELPEIRLPWWDTLNQEWREAIVPARVIQVQGGGAATVETPEAQPEPPAATPVSTEAPNYFWPLLSVVLVLGWAATTWILLQRRRQTTSVQGQPLVGADEREAFQALEKNANANWHQLRPLLLNWGRARWPQQPIHALADLLQLAHSPELTRAVQDLEASHYSSRAGESADTGKVIAEVSQLRAQRDRSTETDTLAALYPSRS